MKPVLSLASVLVLTLFVVSSPAQASSIPTGHTGHEAFTAAKIPPDGLLLGRDWQEDGEEACQKGYKSVNTRVHAAYGNGVQVLDSVACLLVRFPSCPRGMIFEEQTIARTSGKEGDTSSPSDTYLVCRNK